MTTLLISFLTVEAVQPVSVGAMAFSPSSGTPASPPSAQKNEDDDPLMVSIIVGVAALTVLSALALSLVLYQRRRIMYNRINPNAPPNPSPQSAPLLALQS